MSPKPSVDLDLLVDTDPLKLRDHAYRLQSENGQLREAIAALVRCKRLHGQDCICGLDAALRAESESAL